jgi:GxxExxY protein
MTDPESTQPSHHTFNKLIPTKESADQNDPDTYAIIGAAMTVHRELGPGFLEPVYQAALQEELILQNIPHEREVDLPVYYRNKPLNVSYRADFICHGNIIVELKALAALTGKEESQVINYLKATGHHRALLLNFGTPSLQHKRLILSPKNNSQK